MEKNRNHLPKLTHAVLACSKSFVEAHVKENYVTFIIQRWDIEKQDFIF